MKKPQRCQLQVGDEKGPMGQCAHLAEQTAYITGIQVRVCRWHAKMLKEAKPCLENVNSAA